jgi:hypothetical protein
MLVVTATTTPTTPAAAPIVSILVAATAPLIALVGMLIFAATPAATASSIVGVLTAPTVALIAAVGELIVATTAAQAVAIVRILVAATSTTISRCPPRAAAGTQRVAVRQVSLHRRSRKAQRVSVRRVSRRSVADSHLLRTLAVSSGGHQNEGEQELQISRRQ